MGGLAFLALLVFLLLFLARRRRRQRLAAAAALRKGETGSESQLTGFAYEKTMYVGF